MVLNRSDGKAINDCCIAAAFPVEWLFFLNCGDDCIAVNYKLFAQWERDNRYSHIVLVSERQTILLAK